MSVMTKANFARRRHVDRSTVSTWISRGKIGGAALVEGGRIDADEAERQLGVAAIALPDAPQTSSVATAPTVPNVREQILELELQRRRIEYRALIGRYCLASDVRREHGKQLGDLLGAVQTWIDDVVINELGGDREMLLKVRASFRRLRQRESDAAEARAAQHAEYLTDPLDDPVVGFEEGAVAVRRRRRSPGK